MRDEHHGAASVAQRAKHRPELADLEGREHGGRFVENEDLRATIERLEDFDALRFAHREIGDESVGGHGEPGANAEIVDCPLGGPTVEHEALRDFGTEDDVLGDGQGGHEHEVLMHHANTARDRFRRGPAGDIASVHLHAAGVRRIESAENTHQRGFSSAVLTDEGVDLSQCDLEIGTAICLYGPERFINAREMNGDGSHFVLGTEMRPAMISCLSASTRARTAAGIIFSLFVS